MKLTRDELEMLEGKEGPARQKAMELLVKYAEALGARGSGATGGAISEGGVFATPGWTGPLSELERSIAHTLCPTPEQGFANIIQVSLGMADPGLVHVLIEEAVEALELQNLLLLAELEANVCLERTESRGSHYREDFPWQNDKEWLKSITVKKVDGKLQPDIIALDPAWRSKGDEKVKGWG